MSDGARETVVRVFSKEIWKLLPLALLRFLAAALQFCYVASVARGTSLIEFGLVSGLLAWYAIIVTLLGWGSQTALLRSAAQGEDARSALYVTCWLAALTAAFVVAVGSVALGMPREVGIAGTVWALSESVLLATQNKLFSRMMNWQASGLLIVCRVVQVAVVSIATMTEWSIMTLIAVSSVVILVVCACVGFERTSFPSVRKHLALGRPFWGVSVAGMGQQADLLLVTALMGPGPAAGYAAAFRFAAPVHIITSLLTSVYVPRLSSDRERGSRRTVGAHLLLVATGLAVAICAAAPLASLLGPAMFGSEYREFALIFVILVLNSAVSVVNQVQLARVYAEIAERGIWRSTLLATVATLIWVAVWAALGYPLAVVALGPVLGQTLLLGLLHRRVVKLWID